MGIIAPGAMLYDESAVLRKSSGNQGPSDAVNTRRALNVNRKQGQEFQTDLLFAFGAI